MPTWIDLILREGAFVLLLLAFGAGPAAFLSCRVDGATRLAITPILGLCVGTGIFTTLLRFAPAESTYWLLPLVAIGSLAVAVLRTRRATEPEDHVRWWPSRLGAVQLLVVVVAATGPLNFTLHDRETVGPATFRILDSASYVSSTDGAQDYSIGEGSDACAHNIAAVNACSDLTLGDWAFRASYFQQLDIVPLSANLNELIGVGATETQAPFLIVLILLSALGAFAVVRYLTGSHTWAAVLAGGLLGGPLLTQLFFDGSQGALAGLSMLLPFALVAAVFLRGRRPADLVLLALVASGILSLYPLLAPPVGVASASILAFLAFRGWRSGTLRPALPRAAAELGGLVVMAAAMSPVAFERDLRYWKAVIQDTVPVSDPGYQLPFEVLPGWLLQTRELYHLPRLADGGNEQLLLAVALPALFFAVILFGVSRLRIAAGLLVFATCCAGLALYAWSSRDCTYCGNRNLLPIAVVAAPLIGIGVWSLSTASRRVLQIAGLVVALIVVGSVGQRLRIERQRFSNSGYLVDSANRDVLDDQPRDLGIVHLEGYGQSLYAGSEQAFVYHLANERFDRPLSVSLETNSYDANAYLSFNHPRPLGSEFHTDYTHVLTRIGSVRTRRRTLSRRGGIALQQRTERLDVTPHAGLGLALFRVDRAGTAWVQWNQGPLRLYVTGALGNRQTWARLIFRANVPVSVPRQAGVRSASRGGLTVVCVPARGTGTLRRATLTLTVAQATPPPVPRGLFPPKTPFQDIALTEMTATDQGCAP